MGSVWDFILLFFRFVWIKFIASAKIPGREGSISCVLFRLKFRCSGGEHLNMQYLWTTARLLVTNLVLSTQCMSFPSSKWRRAVSLRYHFIVLYFVWLKRIWRQGELTPVVETPSSDSFIKNPVKHQRRSPPQKQPVALTRWLLPQKSPTTDLRPESKCKLD